jgi:hypothetical protein
MKKLIVFSMAAILTSFAFATPNSWVSTRYRPTITSTGSWYLSPVTDGHLDIRLFVDNVTFTDAVFTINYDSDVVDPIGAGSVTNVKFGLSLVSVTTEDLDGSWKKATITLSGNITIGEAQYEQDSIFVLRLIPHSEGVMPITLWQVDYPDSYTTCSLSLFNGVEEVAHERKEYNDGTVLFTFTDKTTTLNFSHDLNFLFPLEGYLQITYADESVETFYQSDESRGIAYYPDYSLWLIDPKPDATQYIVYLPGYYNYALSFNGGMYTSHSQPEDHIWVKEKYEGFYGFQANSEDIIMTAEQTGIGIDFATSQYSARIAGDDLGEVFKSFIFEPIDDDNIKMTLEGGLQPDYYNLYLYKNGDIMGRTWFDASIYYPVTFEVFDADSNPIEGAMIRFVLWGMDITTLDEYTNLDGEATIELPGDPEYGQGHEYNVIVPGYDIVNGYVDVYDSPISVPVQIVKAAGVTIGDFAGLAGYWGDIDCFWDDCNAADLNVDGVIDTEDLMLFAAKWLQGI